MGIVHWQMGQTQMRFAFRGTTGTKHSSNHMRDLAGCTAAGRVGARISALDGAWRGGKQGVLTIVAPGAEPGGEVPFGLDSVLAAH